MILKIVPVSIAIPARWGLLSFLKKLTIICWSIKKGVNPIKPLK